MNFAAVRNANGERVAMSAVANRIDGTTFIPSGSAKQDCLFTDTTGEQQKVTIWQGKRSALATNKVGQTVHIDISCKVSGSYTNYGGFWRAAQQPQGQARPPAGPPQQKQEEKVADTAKDLRDARMSGLNNATRIVCLLAEMQKDINVSPQHIKEVAAEFVHFIYNGLETRPNPDYVGDDPPPPDEDSDIPF